jgi:GWxTD domain-containing protein
MLGSGFTRLMLSALVWWSVAPAVAQETSESELETALLRTWAAGDLTIVDGVANVPLSIMAGGTTRAYRFELAVFDSEDTQLYRDSWERTLSERTAAFAGIETSTLLEPFRFGVMEGAYEVEIHAYPTDAPDLGKRARLSIEAYSGMPVASDLFLADRVEALDDEGGGNWSITLGGFGIAAVARTTVSSQDPRLSYYVELYGGDEAATVEVAAVVLDGAGREVYRTPATYVDVPVGGTPFAGSLALTGLPPGDYGLRLDIGEGESVTNREAPFRILALSAISGRKVESFESRYFTSLSEEELLQTFGGVGYLVTESQRQAFESLPSDAKRRYLTEFFIYGDTDGNPAVNSFLDEYIERIGTVRMRYGELIGTRERPPWTTDVGRIYLVFGEPDERLQNHMPAASDTRSVGGFSDLQGEVPYEIWSYHSTGYVYLFIQENQFDVWRMIFTTDINEQSQAGWQGRIGQEASRDLSSKFGIQPRF